jgi:hypothetical protein
VTERFDTEVLNHASRISELLPVGRSAWQRVARNAADPTIRTRATGRKTHLLMELSPS